MSAIQEFIRNNNSQRLRIAVVGDCMLDQYQYGTVSRVSPEFPVQILTSTGDREEIYPGGAANVCYQMTHLNVDSFLIGLVDEPAHRLYNNHTFNCSYCVNLDSGRVPKKIRFYDGDFPLLRWDIEQPNYGEHDLENLRQKVLSSLTNLASSPLHAVILSDYNKGLWGDHISQDIIGICNAKGIATIVDPKRKPLERWKYCTVFKPNADEALALTGQTNWKDQINYLQSQLKCRAVVITQSGSGVVGKYDNEYFEYRTPRRLRSKEVNSVIGAGDCFNAILAICLGHGIEIADACTVAFEAGVQYVKARHNKPLTPHDICSRFDNPLSKIVTLDELLYLKNNIYTSEDFVFANGCFDIIHQGHLHTLRMAKNKGNKLVVGVNSDDSVRRLKGETRPIQDLATRMQMLSALEYVDFVVAFEEDTPAELIHRLRPHVLVKGGDYQVEQVIGREWVRDVCIVPTLEGFSTTAFLEKMKHI